MTLPRSSECEGKGESEEKNENDAFASKYCVGICIARKFRSTLRMALHDSRIFYIFVFLDEQLNDGSQIFLPVFIVNLMS
jgi:hypothetical protein